MAERYLDGPVWSARDSAWLDSLSAEDLRSMVRHLASSPVASPRLRLRAAIWHVMRRGMARAGGGAR
ncbi:hypothetical protein FZ103_00110 [Streptomonospora sp. PA3]|uniref:hypothetical protein n=1 Tax=Streptomonospora sp. PA3 TaxID=2607326 RepID=UPI0012DF8B75|nr:hypothetical protein [Streptomonospora sp. PA3]MUL39597.1 hypothetical protein [Streptomonospora sp. PA3]